MFFPERIVSVAPDDRVLEVGPGGTPHRRSDVLLEKRFGGDGEAEEQRGYAPALKTDKEVVFYDGGYLPFADREFDYVICSHVLEHVDAAELPAFVKELMRVAPRGYLEFPTIYYDYIYNIPKHVTMLLHNEAENVIYYLPKSETGLEYAAAIQSFFFATTFKGYTSLIRDLKDYFFQGFEWAGEIRLRRAAGLEQLTYDLNAIDVPQLLPQKPWLERVKETRAGQVLRVLRRSLMARVR